VHVVSCFLALFLSLVSSLITIKGPPLLHMASTIENDALEPKVGDILAERYEIKARLGWGNCSSVWLAEHLHHKGSPLIAIKIPTTAQRSHTPEMYFEARIVYKES
jgi:hypothetical protein